MNEDSGGGRPRARPRRMGLLAAVLAGAALLAVGCGGGSHSAGSGASPAQGRVQQLNIFAKCMRSHGELNFYFSSPANNSGASPSGSELSIMGYYVPGVNPQTPPFPAAMKACKHLLPGGGPGPMTQQQINQLVRFAACMRAHGYPDYPDPQVQNGVPAEQPLPASIDTSSPQFGAAQQTCNSAS